MNDHDETPDDEWTPRSGSPEVLVTFADRIRSLRVDALCAIDSEGCGVMSTEHALLALDTLGAAERFMRLALYYRRRND